jgi:hypothetical protein
MRFLVLPLMLIVLQVVEGGVSFHPSEFDYKVSTKNESKQEYKSNWIIKN